MKLVSLGIESIERGLIPDRVTRKAIRKLCTLRLQTLQPGLSESREQQLRQFVELVKQSPIALVPEVANEQHYELPPEFFQLVLGGHRKYSCCLWSPHTTTLDSAEKAALDATCQHAQLQDGQDILELGCGWGSLSLWMAERYPASRITAVSNSSPQRHFILAESEARGLKNLRVVTADMNTFDPFVDASAPSKFDRVVSVEMFEHMRNYDLLLSRIAGWLKPSGKLLIHIFCHARVPYTFETQGTADWMGRYFFTGGMMPSVDLLRQFSRDLSVAEQWTWNGRHYQQTADAWLQRLDTNRRQALRILRDVYGAADARRWLNRWRMFFLAVSELFGYNDGTEWFVSHYLLERSGLHGSLPERGLSRTGT
jgi:cyclopropane-fatty-acyl-phospholipid synthase